MISFLYYMSLYGLVSQILLYTRRRFGFDAKQAGGMMMIVGIGMMISEGLIIRFLLRFTGEKQVLIIGMSFFFLLLLVLGTATQGWMVYCGVSFAIGSGMTQPAITSLVSRAVREDEQGLAQGSINSVRAIAEAIGPLVAGALMMLFEGSTLPGGSFLVCALIAAAAIYVAFNIEDFPNQAPWQKIENSEGGDLIGIAVEIEDSEDDSPDHTSNHDAQLVS